ncbi:MAG: hypothetical protein QNJ17_13460 [Desulfocapsaceae bacterium]|nr:hypothetical protein [Desulfocapsaceae bacterium]
MKPIRTTIFFGIISGIIVLLLSFLPVHLFGWSATVKLYLLLNVTIYGILLCRWSRTPLIKLLFPLGLLTGIAFFSSSPISFILAALAIFSWIRSGLCFAHFPRRTMLAELLTIMAGAGSLWLMPPYGPLSLALTICLFFLLQSLYFFMVPQREVRKSAGNGRDAFEHASGELEKILRQDMAK